jgi:DNA-binding MarR family transcriptional regulator
MSHDRLPDHDLPDHVLRWLEATERRIARELEPRLGAAERSLWPRRLRVLQLVPTAGIRQSELARRALVTKQALGALVDTLETDGFLERSPDPDDARAWIVRPTAAGRRVAASFDRALRAVEGDLAEVVGTQDYAVFLGVLQRLGADEI